METPVLPGLGAWGAGDRGPECFGVGLRGSALRALHQPVPP